MKKKCTKCKKTKSIDCFSWKNKAKKIKQGRCKECYKVINKIGYYKGNRKKQIFLRNKNHRKIAAKFVAEYKLKKGCKKCGYKSFHGALDFHHKKGIKRGCVSVMVNHAYSLETIKREIEKCEVLCANCHRELNA